MVDEEKSGESERGEPSQPLACRGTIKGGKECRYRARFPVEAPLWCSNCDPAQASRRKAAGAVRRFARIPREKLVPTHAPEGDAPPIAASVPTIDYIVDLCLDAAHKVEIGQIDPPSGQAIKGLLGKALDAMKVRGTTGDARGVGETKAKPEKMSAREGTLDAGALSSLERALDA